MSRELDQMGIFPFIAHDGNANACKLVLSRARTLSKCLCKVKLNFIKTGGSILFYQFR